jgi:hypothetical protein
VTVVPRQRVEEFLLEVGLSERRHIVVEGPTDARFLRAWLESIGLEGAAEVTTVGSLDVPTHRVLGLGFQDGERGRVVVVAQLACESDVDLRCIADRDCGHGVDAIRGCDILLWTDFPAIESYVVDQPTLDKANLVSFEERLPEAKTLLPMMGFALRELFAVRLKHENLPEPKYSAGLKRGTSLAQFDVGATVSPHIAAAVDEYVRPTAPDVRAVAYGHDVAELLWAAYPNVFKNQLGYKSRETLERALLGALLLSRSCFEMTLFREVEAWLRQEAGTLGTSG